MTPPPTIEQLLASFKDAQLPWSEEAEQTVVSSIFHHPRLIEECPPVDSFFHVHHRWLIEAFLELFNAGRPIDLPSVTINLREKGLLDNMGGPARLSVFYSNIPMVSHFGYYAGIVRQKYQLRAMIGALAAGMDALLRFNESEGTSAADTLQNVIKSVVEAANDDGSPDLEHRPMAELINEVLQDAEDMAKSGRKITGVSTGIAEFDDIMGGLEPGCLTVVAAESSDGKSSLCRQMLEWVAIEGGCAVDYTYEMMPKAEVKRILCSQGKIDAKNLKTGMLTRNEMINLGLVANKAVKWDFSIVDVAGKTIEQICRDISRRSRKLNSVKRLVAMIDYIQLCKTTENSQNREREVAHITATAKQCAKMTGAHIIMPSQVNNDGEVRESRAIEQDADNLIKIKKIGVKNDGPSWKKGKEEEKPNFQRQMFFHKVRDGERYRTVDMELVGKHFRFEVLRKEVDSEG